MLLTWFLANRLYAKNKTCRKCNKNLFLSIARPSDFFNGKNHFCLSKKFLVGATLACYLQVKISATYD